MKQFQVYRTDPTEQDHFAVLDFATVPLEALREAEQEAYEMAFSGPLWQAESLEEIYDRFPLLCGFLPWIWMPSRGWQPGGLNREWFIRSQKAAARMELTTWILSFLQCHGQYLTRAELLEMLTEILSQDCR